MKQATTIEEQIKKLKSRGMNLDAGEEKTKEILLDIGYFRLGFYCFPFEKTYPCTKNRTHEYRENSCISDVIKLYYLDFDLRHILIKYLNRIEVHFRTNLIYWVSNEFKEQNNTWFADPSVMDKNFITEFDKEIYCKIRGKNKILKEHHSKHINDKYAPAWKTLEFLTFGAIINIYKHIKDESLKQKVANNYGIKSIKTFENYMNAIKEVRNACAHGSVLFDFTLPLSLRKGPAFDYNSQNKNNLYSSCLVIMYILDKVSSKRAKELENKLEELFNNHRDNEIINSVIMNQIGFSHK